MCTASFSKAFTMLSASLGDDFQLWFRETKLSEQILIACYPAKLLASFGHLLKNLFIAEQYATVHLMHTI